jgi:hypothetical protein
MGCGCKNKNQGQATQQTVQTQQSSASQVVQNAIKKTVEKYYEKEVIHYFFFNFIKGEVFPFFYIYRYDNRPIKRPIH